MNLYAIAKDYLCGSFVKVQPVASLSSHNSLGHQILDYIIIVPLSYVISALPFFSGFLFHTLCDPTTLRSHDLMRLKSHGVKILFQRQGNE